MKRSLTPLLLAATLGALFPAPARAAECADLWSWLNATCRRLADTYKYGDNALLVSGYSWHTPWTWTTEKREEENAYAWGGGFARNVERENGDTDTVYGAIFSDSHYKPQYNLGYAWNRYWGQRESIQAGLGYTAVIVARSDIANGFPFPAVLPLVSLRYSKITLFSTFIPSFGGINNGSVVYVFGMIGLP